MISEKQKNEIQNWLEKHEDKLVSIRIRIGQTQKADTIAILTTHDKWKSHGDIAPTEIKKEDLELHLFSTIEENGYNTHETFLRLYAYDNKNKQFSTIQKTTSIDSTRSEEKIDTSFVESISRIVQPLAQAVLKSNQQLINAHEILTNANSYYQETTLRMIESVIETKEEGLDYQELAMQFKVLFDNHAPQQDQTDYSEALAEKVINAFSTMSGMSSPPPPKTDQAQTNVRTKPSKEEMRAWAQDPMFVMDVAQVFEDLQNQNQQNDSNNPEE